MELYEIAPGILVMKEGEHTYHVVWNTNRWRCGKENPQTPYMQLTCDFLFGQKTSTNTLVWQVRNMMTSTAGSQGFYDAPKHVYFESAEVGGLTE